MLERGRALFVAEDDPEDRYLLREAFERAGVEHEVAMFEDGEALIARLSVPAVVPAPGLLLIDLKMPRKSGLDVLEWVRSSERWSVLPVLVLTASAHPGDVSRAYGLGANAFLVKPSSARQLFALAAAVKAFWLAFNEYPSAD